MLEILLDHPKESSGFFYARHAFTHSCYSESSQKKKNAICIFTGDFLFNGAAGVGRDDLPSGRLLEHWNSIQSLSEMPDDVLVCSGHEPPGTELQTLGWNRQHNPILSMESFDVFAEWQRKTAEQLGAVSKIKTALPANIFAEIPEDIPWLSQ